MPGLSNTENGGDRRDPSSSPNRSRILPWDQTPFAFTVPSPSTCLGSRTRLPLTTFRGLDHDRLACAQGHLGAEPGRKGDSGAESHDLAGLPLASQLVRDRAASWCYPLSCPQCPDKEPV